PCQGSNSAYYGPTGLALGQFTGLAGVKVGTVVTDGPVLQAYRAGVQPGFSLPGLNTVASKNGSTITVVLTNACPTSTSATQCASGSVPVRLTFGSGAVPTAVAATTVASTPYANNTDSSPTRVTLRTLSASVSGNA